MRIIPKKTKVSTEFFRGISLWDILVGFFGILVMFLVFLSSLPGKLWIELALFFLFGLLLVRIDEDPNYKFLLQLVRHLSHERRFQKMGAASAPAQQKERLSRRERKLARQEQKAGRREEKNGRKKGKREKKRPHPAPETDTVKDSAVQDDIAQASDGRDDTAQNLSQDEDLLRRVDAMLGEEGETSALQEDLDTLPLTRRDRRMAAIVKKRAAKQKKKARKAEDKFLKSKKVSEEEKAPIRERRKREAEERYYQATIAEQERNRKDIQKMTKITGIHGGCISYDGEYFGAAIEIPAVEFRFLSPHRRTNAIDRALGSVIRSVGPKYAANLVKIERPMVLDHYIDAEYEKIEALKRSYQRGVFSEEELKARIEVIYDRINALEQKNREEKILTPHFYLVLFDSDRRQLENQVQTALSSLQQGEMAPHRLDDKELAVFLRYLNGVDGDEREIEATDPIDYPQFIMPPSLEIKMRTAEVGGIITHTFRVLNYPLQVDDAWGASLFDIPGTKVVMKFSQMDRDKSIRAIDRSISELNSQLDKTGVSSRVIELQTHIETLSELLVMLQNNNENLMAVNLYITAYDIAATRDNKLLVPQPPPSVLPRVSGMKKDIKRTFSELGFKLTDLTGQQFEAFVATQVNGYDPFAQKARGMPSSTVAGVFPWIYATPEDENGLNLGSSDGTPSFIDFFRRDSERVNSNMVIVGKSGGGKSYATKSILTNLAADDTKIFVLDPENEYTELAANLKGKFINVANSSHGRINPFHIITSLEDDEAADGEETSSYAAHLQFLEEFFRQILPEIDGDAMEYLNNLINRVYSRKGIDQYTSLAALRPEDYPVFDDLYDCILEEFQHTKSDYLRSNLRVLMNHVAKFSTGGRNATIWNGPSTLSTVENFIVFNFQTLLANRNNTVANAQMLLVLKYLDNEIIKNREYNIKYGAARKIIVVIDEAHVFIDAKYPLALDFMFQLAKRIRKYNGMQIVITQNIKDFVGSEELARKSTAIINACQYSFIFSLAPNDMHDLCTLYEKAGGINESEQEQIISAPRGQAFVVTSPASRSSIRIETPKPIEEMFSSPIYATHYFGGEEGEAAWEEIIAPSRAKRAEFDAAQPALETDDVQEEALPNFRDMGVDLVEVEEEEVLLMDDTPTAAASLPRHMKAQAEEPLSQGVVSGDSGGGPFSPQALQQYGFEALVGEIRRVVRQEVESELGTVHRQKTEPVSSSPAAVSPVLADEDWSAPSPVSLAEDWFAPASAAPQEEKWSAAPAPEKGPLPEEDWFAPVPASVGAGEEDWFASAGEAPVEEDWSNPPADGSGSELDTLFDRLFAANQADSVGEEEQFVQDPVPGEEETPTEEIREETPSQELPLVYEVTLEQLMAMVD